MKHEKLAQALDHISDDKIAAAGTVKKKKKLRYWLGAVAAVLAIAIIANIGYIPGAVRAQALSLAPEPRLEQRPDRDDYDQWEDFDRALQAWHAGRDARAETSQQALEAMETFLLEGSRIFLAGEENTLWSPLNACIGLSMAAELTAGDTRQQILELLGADSIDTLRSRSSALYESVYHDDGKEICVTANALWLDDGPDYRQQAMEDLSHHYYASIYRSDLGTDKTDKAIASWLSNNTGGLLDKSADSVSLPDEAVLALYSTVYLQAKWVMDQDFNPRNNTTGIFHSPSGDLECTFMNQKLLQTDYYWGEDFGAMSLSLQNGCRMWLILPDEDKTLEDVLASEEYLKMITDPGTFGNTNSKYMKVNLTMPKFDITAKTDLRPGLQSMGLTDVFDPGLADFSNTITGMPVWITSANQSSRIIVDEEGVKAATYIEFIGAGSAMPPEEIIDFVLDRPFLFVLTGSRIPLFAGTVNAP